MALRRFVEVLIGKAPGSASALRVSDLDIKCKVSRTILFEPSTAEVVIYGMKEDSRNVVSAEGNSVVIRAGYEGRTTGVIFSGVVSKASSAHPGPNWVTTISATNRRAVGAALEALPISVSYPRGTQVSRIVEDVAGALGMIALGTSNVQLTLPGNFVYAGNVRGVLRYLKQILAANQKGFFFDNNELVCFNMGEATDSTAVFLDKESGLLSMKPVLSAEAQANAINAKTLPKAGAAGKTTKISKPKVIVKAADLRKRVEFKCILLPQVLPNALVRLDDGRAPGLYLVEKAEYDFDNFGGPWEISAEGTAP